MVLPLSRSHFNEIVRTVEYLSLFIWRLVFSLLVWHVVYGHKQVWCLRILQFKSCTLRWETCLSSSAIRVCLRHFNHSWSFSIRLIWLLIKLADEIFIDFDQLQVTVAEVLVVLKLSTALLDTFTLGCCSTKHFISMFFFLQFLL